MVQENDLSRVRTGAYSYSPATVMAFVSEAFFAKIWLSRLGLNWWISPSGRRSPHLFTLDVDGHGALYNLRVTMAMPTED